MDAHALLARVEGMKREGRRLCLIDAVAILPTATEEGAVELAWSFEKDGTLEHLRERVAPGGEVPSVTGVYPFAFLYENEIRELHGVRVTGLSVDFQGQLYQTSSLVPMSPRAIRERLDAAKVQKP
jgi:ech hydrogenase subunit D